MSAKNKRMADDQLADDKSKRQKDELYALKVAFLKCQQPEAGPADATPVVCTCGFVPCVTKSHHYCKDCDCAGRTCIQKSKCGKLACPTGKLNKQAASAPAPCDTP